MTNQIYIADLNAYNNGTLKGEWIVLPATPEEIEEVVARHSNNGQTDIAIHDYELPFSISEYENIAKLNSLFIWLEENGINISEIGSDLESYKLDNAFHGIKEIAHSIENDFSTSEAVELTNEYIDYEEAEIIARNILSEEGGLARIPYFIGNVNFNNEDIFHINGYENLESVTKDMIKALLQDVLKMAYEAI